MNQWPASGKYMVELLVHHGLSLMLRGMDRKTAKGHAHQTELFSISAWSKEMRMEQARLSIVLVPIGAGIDVRLIADGCENVEWDAAVVHGFEMRRSVWPLPLCTWFR